MKKNKIKIDIYQGVIIPWNIEPPECIALLKKVIADLTEAAIKFPLYSDPNVMVKVTRVRSLQGEKRKLWKLLKVYIRDEILLKFTTTIYFQDQHFPEVETKDFNSNDFYVNHILIPDFEKRYYDFLMALDIARVGALHHGQALLFANSIFVKRLTELSLHSREILSYSLETKWPVFEPLDITKTWDWYLSKTYPTTLDEISSDHVSRAINAFSHLYNTNASAVELLFWAMVGIESLYVSSTNNIMDQVKRKVPLFLGEIKESKNRLTKMYTYRSGFFHGGQNFPNYFHIHDGLDSYDKFITDYSDALSTAEAVLTATLQQMAKHDLSSLKFEYVWTK